MESHDEQDDLFTETIRLVLKPGDPRGGKVYAENGNQLLNVKFVEIHVERGIQTALIGYMGDVAFAGRIEAIDLKVTARGLRHWMRSRDPRALSVDQPELPTP